MSAQCNVLSALLEVFDKSEFVSPVLSQSIYKVVAFVSEVFWTTSGDFDDKWVYLLLAGQIQQFADSDLAYIGVICFPSDGPEFNKIYASFRQRPFPRLSSTNCTDKGARRALPDPHPPPSVPA